MDNILDKLNNVDLIKSNLQKKFELNFNPFPKSGIAIINDSDNIVSKLAPVDEEVTRKIVTYIHDALYSGSIDSQGLRTDKYVSLIVRGEYGSGKTQTLMFIKYLFNNIKNNNIKPYVVYVDNPGQKLSELIGGIVAQIGVENFKKYIWNIFISYLDEQPDIKTDLFRKSYKKEVSLFPISEIENGNYTNLTNTVQNYKELIDKLTFGKNNAEKKQLVERLKSHIINSLIPETGSPVVAEYFYDILSETIGVSKSWDMLTTGNVKELDKREVNILKAIVKIVCEQLEYTDFIILIDEFEEITAKLLPEYFNCSNDDISFEDRSGKKGPEPEDIKTMIIDGKVMAFIGLERIGGVMMYDVSDPTNPTYVDYLNLRDFSDDISGSVSPEGLCTVSAKDSPTNKPMLIIANEVSGDVNVVEVAGETYQHSLTLDKTEIALKPGENQTLNVTYDGYKTLTFSSDNNNVVSINNNVITAINPGVATITVSDGQIQATCKVTVTNPDNSQTGTQTPSTPDQTVSSQEKQPANTAVKTGDESNLGLYTAVSFLAIGLIIELVRRRQKSH